MQKTDPMVRNNVRLTGNPDAARKMVFVHDFGTDQTVWSEVQNAFQDDYGIVLLDNAGAGNSDESAYGNEVGQHLTLRGYAEDLADIGKALGLKDAVLVGHSVGAMIGVLACNMTSGVFPKLVLLAASPRYFDEVGYHGGLTEEAIGGIHLAMFHNYHGWAQTFSYSIEKCNQTRYLSPGKAPWRLAVRPRRGGTMSRSATE
jgi:sigma-B regulation protein RsbQ